MRSWRRIAWVVAATILGTAVASGLAFSADDPKTVRKIVIAAEGEDPTVITWEGEGEDGAFLGVELREETESAEGGARIAAVIDDSPADKAGLRKGDVVVRFGGDVIRGPAKLTQKIHQAKAGDKVDLEIVRDGSRKTLAVELGKRQRPWARRLILPEMKAYEESLRSLEENLGDLEGKESDLEHKLLFFGRHHRAFLGVQLVDTTPDLREALGAGRDAGVLVGKVRKDSPAAKAGIRAGDVIVSLGGAKVKSPVELREQVLENEGKTVDVELVRDKKPMKVTVSLPAAEEEDEEELDGPRARAPLPPLPPPHPPAPPVISPAAFMRRWV